MCVLSSAAKLWSFVSARWPREPVAPHPGQESRGAQSEGDGRVPSSSPSSLFFFPPSSMLPSSTQVFARSLPCARHRAGPRGRDVSVSVWERVCTRVGVSAGVCE